MITAIESVEAVGDRRPILNEHVFNEIRTCKKCGVDERMIFWRNVHAKSIYQFEFLVCRCCGHTIILQSFIEFSKAEIDLSRPDIMLVLHDLTKGSRAAATKFEKAETVRDAISIHNIRYITNIEADKIVRLALDKITRQKEDALRRQRAAEEQKSLTEVSENVRANGINFRLKLTRARQEARRKENETPMIFDCKYCRKKFPTKSKLHNHRCKSTDKETYIERAARRANQK